MDVQSLIAWTKQTGTLVDVDRAVDPHLELARVMVALDGQPVLFRKLAGFAGWRAISGVCERLSV